MNKQRRNEIATIISSIEELKNDIEMLQEEEQEYYDNMPEAFQQGEKGEKANEAIDALGEAIYFLDDVISSLETASE